MRYNAYNVSQPRDDIPSMGGDNRFIGVNMRLDPAQLPEGYVSEAINMRFRDGVASTRKGHTILPWANRVTAGKVQAWTNLMGASVFSDPFTLTEYLIVAANSVLWATTANNAPFQLPLTAGTTVTTPVQFTQAFDTMILHQGFSLPTLQMPRIQTGFDVVVQSNNLVIRNADGTTTGTGTLPIPNVERSLFFQNRLFLPKSDDGIAVSDYGDYTRYLPVAQEFRINQGSADNVVTVSKFNDITIVVFKQHSIYVVNNIYGNLAAAQQDEVTTQFGLVAAKSVAQCGSDLLFLSELGVMTLKQTEQNKLQNVTLPLSDPIQPLIDRINWKYASKAVAAYWDSKYYLAVPLDDAEILGPELSPYPTSFVLYDPSSSDAQSLKVKAGSTYRYTPGADELSLTNGSQVLTNAGDFVAQGNIVTVTGYTTQPMTASLKQVYAGVNNAVLVYDFLTSAWCGYDDCGADVVDFFKATVSNRTRLLFVSSDGWVKLYEEDYEDQEPRPYIDCVLSATPAVGATIQVNGGGTITAVLSGGNTSTTWGTGDLPTAAGDLYEDLFGAGGYQRNWSAPNTVCVPIVNGVRFYSTDGIMPVVVTTGTINMTFTETATRPIQSSVTTRGYTNPMLDLARFNWLNADLQTWSPTYSLTAVGPGVERNTVYVSGQTRDRTLYYEPADQAPFNVQNTNNDFAVPGRQDYSLNLGPDGASQFDLWSASGGVRLDYHQEVRHTERVNMTGRAVQLKLTNTTGRVRLMAVRFEGDPQPLFAGTANAN